MSIVPELAELRYVVLGRLRAKDRHLKLQPPKLRGTISLAPAHPMLCRKWSCPSAERLAPQRVCVYHLDYPPCSPTLASARCELHRLPPVNNVMSRRTTLVVFIVFDPVVVAFELTSTTRAGLASTQSAGRLQLRMTGKSQACSCQLIDEPAWSSYAS